MIMLPLTFAWPPDLNHMEDYNWGVIEWETNKHTHDTKDSLKAAIEDIMETEIKNTWSTYASVLEDDIETII